MFQILPGLYVGNFRDAKNVEQLTENNITHILSIHDNAKEILGVSTYIYFDCFSHLTFIVLLIVTSGLC